MLYAMPFPRTGRPTLQKLWPSLLLGLAVTTLFCAGQTTPAPATVEEEAVKKLRQGDYEDAAIMAQKAIKDAYPSETLLRVAAEGLMTQGKYNEAYTLLKDNLRYSFRLLLLMREACLYTGKANEAQQLQNTMMARLASLADQQQYYQAPLLTLAQKVDAGEAILQQKTDPRPDPKTLLQQYFTPGEQATPPVRDAFLNAGQLGLEKHDYRLASTSFGNGLKAFPDDADFLSGMAAAFRPSDREKFADYARQALAANPRHVPTLIMLADNLIDAEEFDKAKELLQKILAINPHEQSALALQAVIAYLHNQPDQGDAYRTRAHATWSNNPAVDNLIGLKLSQNYRFDLGAKFQRLALESDPGYTPAAVQLAQDLLRLGKEDEGWTLAEKAHKDDGYDIEAFNLATLHDEIADYTIIDKDGFKLCMEPVEARVYGSRVLDLLGKVRASVATKYGAELPPSVLVEVFPNAADFSVRTFGMPDIGEFLGVTFGPVVTINSPTTHDSNWEDVLWHEFTHVITLTMTHNRMPRWLSEGISVYEEHQGRPEWGQLMSMQDYQRIMTDKMQPISSMSAAFLQAKEPGDTQFAYFESSLIVQYLVEKYGHEHLKALLEALGRGEEINDALAHSFAPVAQLDEEFTKYAKEQAAKFAKGWMLLAPDKAPGITASLSASALANPDLLAAVDPHDFNAKMDRIQGLLAHEEWAKARDQLQEIIATGLYLPGPENLQLMLAQALNKLGDTAGEKVTLTFVAEHEGDSLAAASRLLEISQQAKDWPAVKRWSEATVAIHPLSVAGWRGLLDASEQLHDNAHGIEAGLALLELAQPDVAALNYRVARLMQPTDVEGARRHVLLALEEAPRFRAAYELLSILPTATTAPAPEPSAANLP